jgi:glycine oxidase
MRSEFDFIILGQGLAGTSLAWFLRWAGARFLVVDRQCEITSSRIAAGLVTPITGQKLIKSWRFDEFWPAARAFYCRVESETKTQFFVRRSMVRLFAGDVEALTFQRRRDAGEYLGLVHEPHRLVDENWFDGPLGGFEMSEGGQLDVPGYLDSSRKIFEDEDSFLIHDVDVSRDLNIDQTGVVLPTLGVRGKTVVCCQGAEAMRNPWFREVQFKPAKGEILTLRIPGLSEGRVVHRGVWLAPIGGDLFKAGSTYDWKSLDLAPTQSGRDEIVNGLRSFLRLPFEIVGHDAGVRPIHRNQYPILGRLPAEPRLACFNGLGSKGVLQAPYFARQMSRMLIDGQQIDASVDLNKKTKWASKVPPMSSVVQESLSLDQHVKRGKVQPLTIQAHDAVRELVRKGEIAIDATAGNGHDTQFLAELVGSDGTVFAFDIQESALEKTARRLNEAKVQNVILIKHDHADLATLIPREYHGRVAAVMFNLGYLPGADKEVVTNAESSRSGIHQAVTLLRPGGVLTALAYTGHDGGNAEADAIAEVLGGLPIDQFEVSTIESQPGRRSGPKMFHVKRRLVTADKID